MFDSRIFNTMNKPTIIYLLAILTLTTNTLKPPPLNNHDLINVRLSEGFDDDDVSMIVVGNNLGVPSFVSMLPVVFVEYDYQNFDLQNLTTDQKQIDSFIRKEAEIPELANLTEAGGSDNIFRFAYREKSEEIEKNWIITVLQSDEEKQNKYKIIGRSIIATHPMTEEEKKQLKQSLKKAEEQREKAAKQFEKSMEQMERSLQEAEREREKQMEDFEQEMEEFSENMENMGDELENMFD